MRDPTADNLLSFLGFFVFVFFFNLNYFLVEVNSPLRDYPTAGKPVTYCFYEKKLPCALTKWRQGQLSVSGFKKSY